MQFSTRPVADFTSAINENTVRQLLVATMLIANVAAFVALFTAASACAPETLSRFVTALA